MRNQLLEPLLSRAVASSHATARWMNGRVDLDLHFRTRHVGLAPRLDLVLSKPKNRPTKRKYSKEQVGKGPNLFYLALLHDKRAGPTPQSTLKRSGFNSRSTITCPNLSSGEHWIKHKWDTEGISVPEMFANYGSWGGAGGGPPRNCCRLAVNWAFWSAVKRAAT
jgi:hypothetical protein